MHYALPSQSKYPIETEEQLKLANDYFGKYLDKFHPTERAEIAGHIEKRADDLNADFDSGWIKNYSRRTNYSPDFDFHMKMRKEACVGRAIKVGENEVSAQNVLEKIAEKKSELKPGEMVYLIADFDKTAGLESFYDRRMRDPIFTVFGSAVRPDYDIEKRASGITDKSLKKVAADEGFISKLASSFGPGFANDFKDSPVDIYNSMPAPEKELINGLVKTASEKEDDEDDDEKKEKKITDKAVEKVKLKCPKCPYRTTGTPGMKCPQCGVAMVAA